MNFLTIKQKLLLVMIVPFLGLLYFSISSISQKYKDYQSLKHFEDYLDYSHKANSLIHELQKERGLSAGYMGSQGISFEKRLAKQRKLTDDVYNNLKNNPINTNLSLEKYIPNFRKDIDSFNISSTELIKFYTEEIDQLIYTISNISILSNYKELSTQSLGLLNIIHAKEYAGLERGIVNHIFTSEIFTNQTYANLSVINSKFSTHIKLFKEYSDKKSLNYFNDKTNSPFIFKYRAMQNLLSSKIYKNEIISEIKETLGYGGLIHNFKNYLLRGDEHYKDNVLKNYNQLTLLIDKYKEYNITDKEYKLLDIILTTMNTYKEHLIRISSDSDINISLMDKKLKVNDKYALIALKRLETKISGVNSTKWFELSTKRIEILKNSEDSLFSTLFNIKDNLKSTLLNTLRYQAFFSITLLIVISILFYIIYTDILTKLKSLQFGLTSFLSYVTKKEIDYQLLPIVGNDEFTNLSNVINTSISKTAIHIEEEVKLATVQEKQIQESSKMVQMGEMIGNIAHQWRQPLSVISTSASGMLIEKEYDLLTDDKFIDYCENIVKNTEVLSETIDIFRDITNQKKESTKVIIQDRLDISIKIITASLENQHIKLINNINYKHPIELTIMMGELSQVIINIFNNAKDILLERKITDAWIKIDCFKKDKIAYITIEDNAKGIDKDILPKIFEPYFTTKHQSQGKGLGLHLSYKIIHEHLLGKIYATNTQNGAIITIELPIK